MRLGPSLLVTMALVWSALMATTMARQQSPAAPRESSLSSAPLTPPSASAAPAADITTGPSGDYVGSAACKRCHDAEHGQWQKSLHVQMTRPVAEATILGDFTEGTRLSEFGRSYEFGRRNGVPFMRIAFGDSNGGICKLPAATGGRVQAG